MKTRFFLLSLILSLFIYQPIFAIKAYPFPIEVTQPDGSSLTIKLKGDESFHYQTSEDGYLLKKNANGYFTYATLSATGETLESSIIARNISKRTSPEIQFLKTAPKSESQLNSMYVRRKSRVLSSIGQPRRAYPLNGSPKALVILVNFSDKAFTVPTPITAYQNLLTQVDYSANGGTGSAKDYFMASSYGKFAPNFIVVGPVTLPQTLDYYGKNNSSKEDTNPAQMVLDACNAANLAGLDFTQFDTDGDSYVDNVFVYYAGYNEAEGGAANTIWPHRWNISSSGITTGITFDGKKIEDYSCTSELKGTSGTNMCGIGTFCHEFGHVLGLPDFYDTSGTQSNTLDYWEIMDAGAYNNGGCTPPTYSCYERFFLGYSTPEQISSASDLTLLPIYQGTTQPANTTNQSFLFSATTHNLIATNPTPKEFFMVEYRKKIGWDAYLPGEGMCIWHVDYNQSAWDNNEPNNYTGTDQTAASHMRFYLQPLSGTTTTPGDAFTSGSFTPTTWAGTNINRPITAITKTTDNIKFKFMGGAVGPVVSATGSISDYTTIFGTPSALQSINVSGQSLTNNLNINLPLSSNFEIKLSTETLWSKSLSIVPNSGSVNITVNVRYNPLTAGSQTENLQFTSTGASNVNFGLSGTSTVPIDPNAPNVFIGKVDNNLQFPTTKINVSTSKTINIKTTDIVGNLSLSITGTNTNLFTVSASSITKDAANATNGLNITVTYIPTSIGEHSATLTISGGGLNDKVITLTGNGI
jgi:M6 family metalloprotease-like protein